MKRVLGLLILTLVVGCAALSAGAAAQEEGAENATAGPRVSIVEPTEGAILAGNVTVRVNLTNFTLVEPPGEPDAPGGGLLHYYLDAPVPANASAPAVPETGWYAASTNTTHTWENVTPGEHNLSVQLVNDDGTPLVPLVFETVNVTVGDDAAVMNLTAADFAFDTEAITVPAGAVVTVFFRNEDQGIPHNLAVYDSSLRSERFFMGEFITGPAETVYTFIAPSLPGTYYFQCDAHPFMNGDFIVG